VAWYVQTISGDAPVWRLNSLPGYGWVTGNGQYRLVSEGYYMGMWAIVCGGAAVIASGD
jgi:hypothetical protein